MATKTTWLQFNTASVDPAWNWFWAGDVWALPIWEGGGQPYAYTNTTLRSIGNIQHHSASIDSVAKWKSSSLDTGLIVTSSTTTLVPAGGLGTLIGSGSFTLFVRAMMNYSSFENTYLVNSPSSILIGRTSVGNQPIICSIYTTSGSLATIYGPLQGSLITGMHNYVAQFNVDTQLIHFWVDGVQYISASAGGTFVTGSTFTFGSSVTSDEISLIGVQRGIWSDAQVAQWHNNPYGPLTYAYPQPRLNMTTVLPEVTLVTSQSFTPFYPVSQSGGLSNYSYSVSPPLPDGLVLNATTGIISGWPSTSVARLPYEITVTDNL